jgi:hypothetical protein
MLPPSILSKIPLITCPSRVCTYICLPTRELSWLLLTLDIVTSSFIHGIPYCMKMRLFCVDKGYCSFVDFHFMLDNRCRLWDSCSYPKFYTFAYKHLTSRNIPFYHSRHPKSHPRDSIFHSIELDSRHVLLRWN